MYGVTSPQVIITLRITWSRRYQQKRQGNDITGDLLLLSEARVSRLIQTCLPESRRHWVSNDLLSHLMFMAHDGFAMNYNLEGLSGSIVKADRVEKIVQCLCDILLQETPTD